MARDSDSSSCSGSSSSGDSSDDGRSVVGPLRQTSGDSGDEDEAMMLALAKSLGDDSKNKFAKKSKSKSKSKGKFASKTDKLDLAVRASELHIDAVFFLEYFFARNQAGDAPPSSRNTVCSIATSASV